GRAVDREFERDDVRLTMGGEPTFVSIDDMESTQWNTDALGDDKLSLAKTLLLRLRDRFAPHGLLHYGQGKWYPGEEIPRWALGVFWRKDGEPLWKNAALLARVDKDYSHDIDTAARFGQHLCDLLQLPRKCCQAAYEDGLYYLLQEQNLPKNLDLLAQKLKGSLDRRRLARLIERGFTVPTGFVIPLRRSTGWPLAEEGKNWHTSLWPMKRERITLLPGDSPMGLRLPLNDLPELAKKSDRFTPQRDPFEPRDALVKRADMQFGSGGETPEAELPDPDDYEAVVRTALCLEPRGGRLHAFIPPLEYLEDYVELVAAIEDTAAALKLPLIIEGYEPPRDPRLQKLLVTPDPGVIEVNVHPSNNWEQLVDITTALYEEARLSRLSTEKFMLDGRHTGTGGGNHITLGGATPADSPLLRRPDLLRSLITYWQHHPSLSYLFSGMFIGPTSQAPRVDEGRDEMLYELEVAFAQMADGKVPQPWLVDRLLRNLLIDVTGNTHRTEFSIDKLYSPDGPTGRLGLL
ncbi:MAG: transglutaminase family protein, partial [Halioglobus sp.]